MAQHLAEDAGWLYDGLTSIQHSSIASIATDDNHDDRVNDILRRIIFSKHFVPTYYIPLAFLVLVFGVRQWGRKRASRERRTDINTQDSITQSSVCSSSSTLRGIDSTPTKIVLPTENEPLLARPRSVHPLRHGFFGRIRCRIGALLAYQPRPRPALTAPMNKLPANDTTLAIVALLALNIFYLFFRNSVAKWNTQVFADRAGFCFVANLPVLYLLAAKSNHLLTELTGWSYERLNIFHRRLGEWMLLLAFTHTFGMVGLWYTVFRLMKISLGTFLAFKIIYIGLAALGCFTIVWTTSTGYVRRKSYELFLVCHIVFQFAGLALLFFHHRNSRPYVCTALAVWAVDRLSARSLMLTKKFIATLELTTDDETVLLFVDIPISSRGRWRGIKAGWCPGQHVYLAVPAMGRTQRYQMHPFTIASPAPPTGMDNATQWPLQLIVRSRDGFSGQLREYAKLHQHVEILLDGPYGSTQPHTAVCNADRTMLIAGGSGISVTYPLSWAIHAKQGSDEYLSRRVIYKDGARWVPSITTVPPSVRSTLHHHIWIRQSRKHENWIKLIPQLATEPDLTPEETNHLHSDYGMEIINKVYNTRDDSGGRPDISSEIQDWLLSDTDCNLHATKKICLVVCGPDQLARQVRNCAATLFKDGWDIEVFVESFEW